MLFLHWSEKIKLIVSAWQMCQTRKISGWIFCNANKLCPAGSFSGVDKAM